MLSETSRLFQTSVLWAQLAAANARSDAFCIEEHRQALLNVGEPEQRLRDIGFWKLSHFFSEAERAVIAFSESISVSAPADKLDVDLIEIKRFFDPEEIQQLSSSVLAVNEWIDIHGKKPVRVIVVEDNEDDQELLGRQLRKTGLGDHILFLSDPKAALQLINGPFSGQLRKTLVALILDVHLPHMSGIELLRIIRSLESWGTFPVVMMTTDNSPANVAACKDLNVMAFVAKPLTFSSFASAVAPLFHQASMS